MHIQDEATKTMIHAKTKGQKATTTQRAKTMIHAKTRCKYTDKGNGNATQTKRYR